MLFILICGEVRGVIEYVVLLYSLFHHYGFTYSAKWARRFTRRHHRHKCRTEVHYRSYHLRSGKYRTSKVQLL